MTPTPNFWSENGLLSDPNADQNETPSVRLCFWSENGSLSDRFADQNWKVRVV